MTTTKTAPDYTLSYLTQEELRSLRSRPITKTYRWKASPWKGGGEHSVEIRFRVASATYVGVFYDGQCVDCINTWDDDRPTVRTRDDFRKVVEEYWADQDTVRDYIRGALGIESVR